MTVNEKMMKTIEKIKPKNIEQSAKKTTKNELDNSLIEILFGLKKGNEDQINKLEKLKKKLKKTIYSEAIYHLSNIEISNKKEAELTCNEIIKHINNLNEKLGRNAGLSIGILDYFKNFKNEMNTSICMDEGKAVELSKAIVDDQKTKTYDFALLDSDLDIEIERANRFSTSFSLIFIDIDKFKKINDTYGHLVGDKALEFTASILRDNSRRYDLIYRYGGDEFIILLPGTDENSAVKVCYHLKKILNDSIFDPIKKNISISIGIASFGKYNIDTKEKLLNAADKALYGAKDIGDGEICIYQGKKIYNIQSVLVKNQLLSKNNKRIVMTGISISKKCAIGKAYIFKDVIAEELKVTNLKSKDIDDELTRMYSAIKKVDNDLSKMQKSMNKNKDNENSNIFNVHKMILQDKSLLIDIENDLKKRMLNSEIIIKDYFKKLEEKFKSSRDVVFSDKALDIADIGNKVLEKLKSLKSGLINEIPKNSIVFVNSVLPSETFQYKDSNIKAIVTFNGSIISHSAILLKSMGIPYITNIDKEYDMILNGNEVLFDGHTGKIIINPEIEEKNEHLKKIRSEKQKNIANLKKKSPLNFSKNNEKITINANISIIEDAYSANKYNCDNVGLIRIENIYMTAAQIPDADYLYQELVKLLEPVKDKEITIRLLDIGGDKKLPYLDIFENNNNMHSLRGVRLLLKFKKLLETQINALIKLNEIMNIRILVPMVIFIEDMVQVRNTFNNIKKNYQNNNNNIKDLKIGAMIETPASVMNIDALIKYSDFLSIGTNDLIQYTFAVDRENSTDIKYIEKSNYFIMDSLKIIFEKAKAANMDCGICGEIAGDLAFTENLINIGCRNFSVMPEIIPELRHHLSKVLVK